MPRGDGTGPAGMGSMTGRAAGYCAGYSAPGFVNPIPGRGYFGYGRGIGLGRGWFGRGFGRGQYPYAPYYRMPYAGTPYAPTYPAYSPYTPAYPQPTAKDEKAWLEEQLSAMEKEMKSIRARIGEIEKQEKK